MQDLADRIDALLPQTQCTRCGYAGCRPYAEAIAAGYAPVNRCPPGGQAGIDALARLTGSPPLPLDPACGQEGPLQVAFVVEDWCIGCTKCIQACPVDAIVGASRWLHTVVPELCTGCGLCVPPCPVDCIEMHDARPPRAWTATDAAAARRRQRRRAERLELDAAERDARLARKALQPVAAQAVVDPVAAEPAGSPRPPDQSQPERPDAARKRAIIEAAVARARVRAASRAAP